MAGTKTKNHRPLGPYSRVFRRGAVGASIDGRSTLGRQIRDMETQLIQHTGAPTVTQRLLITRLIKIHLQLDALDAKLTAGNWTEHDARTHGGLQNAYRLTMRELGMRAQPQPAPSLAEVFGRGAAA
jgi:hypothetical protein